MAIEQMDSQGEEHLHAKLGGSAISLGGSAAASWAHRSPIHQTEAEEVNAKRHKWASQVLASSTCLTSCQR
ncbi:hypothetical protein PSTT_01190 [Puccinia striiformis]|uniref:Uncharacterized protein n=1 Tax=Puccinia striiformis TaxID=27350 RepID=A0A2S4W4L6_9BASI|nr:hypothetical protein PSTT_01190 [Puccinia striiformis]